jgi:hypothetical protein
MPSSTTVILRAAALVLTVGTMTSCSGDAERTVSAYCGVVQRDVVAINDPTIATPADIAATIRLYEGVAAVAPIAIEPEWQRLIDTLETASTLVPGDTEGLARVNDAALASQPAATRIIDYTMDNCGTAIG